MGRPLSSRKLDVLYLFFFLIHIPIIFVVDITPLYPVSLKPGFMKGIRQWYIDTYHDRFFSDPPAWFMLFIWTEALYHVPLSLWAVKAVWKDDARVPLQLLIWAVQTAVTTATCVVEFMSWAELDGAQKLALSQLYVPYLGIAVFMGFDMFGRLNREVIGRRLVKGKSI